MVNISQEMVFNNILAITLSSTSFNIIIRPKSSIDESFSGGYIEGRDNNSSDDSALNRHWAFQITLQT